MTTWISTPSIHPSQSHAAVPEDIPRPPSYRSPAPYRAQPRPGERYNLRHACLGSALVPRIWLGN